ncbi:MAG: sugar kinase [Litoreibacter sp.]|nr:sugar kinase [Litoreibacter sp.]
MTSTPDILALGEALMEFVKIDTDAGGRPLYRQGFGGDTSNAIIAAARQGARTGYLTAVGGDPFGQALLGLWKDENVSTEGVRVKEQDPTGSYFVLPDPAGRQFSYARRGSAASLYGPDDLDEAAIAAAKVLHVSALSQAISASMRDAVTRAAEIARASDTLVSYDTNLRLNLWSLEDARATIEAFLPLADIVLPSDDEAETLTGSTDEAAILEYFGAYDPKVLLLKRGAKGPLLRAHGQDQSFEVPTVTAVDSTGAGDSFAGGFLAYFLESGDAAEATRRAMKVAAGTVSGFGAVDPIPYRKDVV